MNFGSDSSDTSWVLLTEIFRCRAFAAVFTDKRNTHVFFQLQTVALLLVDVRIVTSSFSDDEAKSFLRVEVLWYRQN